jgi:hypothetical protein
MSPAKHKSITTNGLIPRISPEADSPISAGERRNVRRLRLFSGCPSLRLVLASFSGRRPPPRYAVRRAPLYLTVCCFLRFLLPCTTAVQL